MTKMGMTKSKFLKSGYKTAGYKFRSFKIHRQFSIHFSSSLRLGPQISRIKSNVLIYLNKSIAQKLSAVRVAEGPLLPHIVEHLEIHKWSCSSYLIEI